jgi:hypothetical protein
LPINLTAGRCPEPKFKPRDQSLFVRRADCPQQGRKEFILQTLPEKIHAYEKQNQTPAERRASMTWAQRLKRDFNTGDDVQRGQ